MNDDADRLSPEQQRVADLIAASGREPLQQPPPRVWGAIADELGLDGGRPADPTPAGRFSRRTLALGVAAGAVAGALAGWGITRWVDAEPVVLRRAPLDTQGTSSTEGEATVERLGDRLRLSIRLNRPLAADGGYLEVWLLNTDGERMVSVGVLAGLDISYPITQPLLDQDFLIVDISREPLDGDTTHSGVSLVRGRLT